MSSDFHPWSCLKFCFIVLLFSYLRSVWGVSLCHFEQSHDKAAERQVGIVVGVRCSVGETLPSSKALKSFFYGRMRMVSLRDHVEPGIFH